MPSFWGQRAWQKTPGPSFGQIFRGTPSGGAGQSVWSGIGSKAKDIGLKAGVGTLGLGAALGGSIAAEEGMRRALGDEQSALSPESMTARGAYAMTPQGRMGYY
jgi:hypothetical protein